MENTKRRFVGIEINIKRVKAIEFTTKTDFEVVR
jgi:hypothetical protein